MWETYGNYIIGYTIIGFVHFLICYGITVRVIKENIKNSLKTKFSIGTKISINWSELIILKGIFWPIGIVMEIVKIISTIGV